MLPPSPVPFSCIKGSPPQHYGHLGPRASLSGAVLCPVMSSSTPGLRPLNADGTPPPDVMTKMVSRHQQVSHGGGEAESPPSRTPAPHPHPLECSQHPESQGCVSGCRDRHAGSAREHGPWGLCTPIPGMALAGEPSHPPGVIHAQMTVLESLGGRVRTSEFDQQS